MDHDHEQLDDQCLEDTLMKITMATCLNGVRLLLAWSLQEGARILETLHCYGVDKAAEVARGAPHGNKTGKGGGSAVNNASDVRDTLSICGLLGPKEATNIINHFGCLQSLIDASLEQLQQVPGIGPKKASLLHAVFNAPLKLPT